METAHVLKIPEKSFQDLYLLFCGHAVCEPLHSFGPAVRPNYIIHYILSGKGNFYLDNKTYTLKAGQGFLIVPNVLTKYEADQEDPWSYVWIGFDGTNCEQFLNNIGLGPHRLFFKFQHEDQVKDIIDQMLLSQNFDYSTEFKLQGLLYQLFSLIAENRPITKQNKIPNENEYVRKAIDFIQIHYHQPIQVLDIANFVSINRSYLSTIFKQEIGLSINQYLTKFRITRAAELLTLTDLSVEQISESCGYRDSLVFSKAFKRKKHLTPTQYRIKSK